jgi:vacuolar protein sorting-associated protein 13A/C
VILVNEDAHLGTLSLATASVTLLLQGDALRVSGRLGSLALRDESELHVVLPDFKRVVSIEDDNFAVFRYETFDSHEGSPFKSSFFLTAGSVKVHFLEKPLHDYNLFITKLARLKGLYDAAAHAAVQRASEIERLRFEVSVRSPIIVFPINPSQSLDVFVMKLGEISAKNFFQGEVSKTEASLRGIQLVSKSYYDANPFELKLIYNIDLSAQVTYLDRTLETEIPVNQVWFINILFPHFETQCFRLLFVSQTSNWI